MKMLALVASLLTASAVSANTPQPTPPPLPGPPTSPLRVCAQAGTRLIALQTIDQTRKDAVTMSLTLWDSGALDFFELDRDGRRTREFANCLDDAKFATIRAALAKATWKLTPYAAHCAAVSTTRTDWTVRGKVVFSEEACPSGGPDSATQPAVEAITALETMMQAPSGPDRWGGHKH